MGKENMKNCLSWINFYNPTDDWYYLKEKDKTTYLQKYAKVVEQIKSEGAKLLVHINVVQIQSGQCMTYGNSLP